MPSKMKFLCCTCDVDDNRDNPNSYERVKVKRRDVRGKNVTWTRRSLLDNEQPTMHDIPFDSVGDHVTGSDPYAPEGLGYAVTEMKTFDDLGKPKRRTAKEVFEHGRSAGQAEVNTTFPWMNEDFVPNNRSGGPRLGISSVQINARRNEQANRNIYSAPQPGHVADKNRLSRQFNGKSQSFNEGEHRGNAIYAKPMIRTNVAVNQNGNLRTVPNGYGFRGNVTTVVNKANTVAAPTGRSDRPLILHAPNTEVGVRVVSSKSKVQNGRIPKLGDYLVLKPDDRVHGEQARAPHAHNHGVQSIWPIKYKQLTENQSDISFSSEVTFRKSEPGPDTENLSLKRSKRPDMFSNNKKYHRLKTNSDMNVPYSVSDTSGPKTTLDSMYGYVPKAVQHVQASNALSGGRIDDFFMQRLADTDLDKFASINRQELTDWQDLMDANYIGSARPKSVPAFVNMGHTNGDLARDKSGEATPAASGGSANGRVGLQQIRLKPPPGWRNSHDTQPGRLPDKGHNSPGNVARDSGKDENENKVIMIDFPPNPGNEKQDNKAWGNQTSAKVNGQTKTGVSNDSSMNKLMINPLVEKDDVLY